MHNDRGVTKLHGRHSPLYIHTIDLKKITKTKRSSLLLDSVSIEHAECHCYAVFRWLVSYGLRNDIQEAEEEVELRTIGLTVSIIH